MATSKLYLDSIGLATVLAAIKSKIDTKADSNVVSSIAEASKSSTASKGVSTTVTTKAGSVTSVSNSVTAATVTYTESTDTAAPNLTASANASNVLDGGAIAKIKSYVDDKAAKEAAAAAKGITDNLKEGAYVDVLDGKIADSTATNDSQLVTAALVKAFAAGVAGAMHFEGVKDSLPANTTGYEDGDVILVGTAEYVVSNGQWVLFGDEGAYEPKGTVANIASKSADNTNNGVKVTVTTEAGSVKSVAVDASSLKSTVDGKVASVTKGTDGDYFTTTIGGTATAPTVAGAVTVQAVDTASATAKGLAEASDVKAYVDGAVSGKNVTAEGDTYVGASAANNKVTVSTTTTTVSENATTHVLSAPLAGLVTNAAISTINTAVDNKIDAACMTADQVSAALTTAGFTVPTA